MKIIDRYITKSFLTGYIISTFVLVGLRMLIDLFINIDEFVEASNEGFITVLINIATYYSVQSALYFRDFAGIITVVAAAFTFGKMTRANELVALMASGVSLKRVIVPVMWASILLTGLLVVDQEIIIPGYASLLVRSHDSINKQQSIPIECLVDGSGNIIHAKEFSEADSTMSNLTIILRDKQEEKIVTTGWIRADKAIYDKDGKWLLYSNRTKDESGNAELVAGGRVELFSGKGNDRLDTTKKIAYSYSTDLTPEVIPIRRNQRDINLLSSAQLSQLAKQGANIKDRARLYTQRYSRFTDPIVNFVMLLVALPVLVCRDKKQMKFAVFISFTTTSLCFILTFVCKMLATEPIFGMIIPDFWVALPVILFMPVAVLELNSIKT